MSDVKYDPAECERLEREAREDDERMTSASWRYDRQGWVESMDRGLNHSDAETEVLTLGARNEHDDGEGVARTRNNLRALADQLSAARAEIERLARAAVCDRCRDEIERLRADSKTAWEQADILADGLERACSALVADRGADTLRATLRKLYRDAYRAARDKAGT